MDYSHLQKAVKQTIKQPKLSDVILSQLEAMIIEGSLKPGQKLLPERELAKLFDVSRPSLREAIQKLEAKNLVVRRQGGGTYVCEDILSGLSDPLFKLLANDNEAQFDLLEFRLGIEGMSAYYAAMRGTETDFAEIERKHQAIGNAQLDSDQQENYHLEAEAVFDFYLAICSASHNAVILHLARSMSTLLIDNIEQNLTMLAKKPEIFAKITDYRTKLLEAILSGKPQRAWGASHQHLSLIEEVLLKLNREQSRMERSMRRLHSAEM